MGVVHLASIGKRPGAVTSALSYLKHNKDNAAFSDVKGSIIESVILFTSFEIFDGAASVKECHNNQYGTINESGPPWENYNVITAAKKFIEKELIDIIPEKGDLSVCVVNPNDYNDCFKKIAEVVLNLSHQNAGKHIWANLTGGTNILNTALLEVAFLSGRIARLYYTFLSDVEDYGNYLQPPSLDNTIFDWREIPFVKTNFDASHYKVLETLAEKKEWCEDIECLSRLKKVSSFNDLDLQDFKIRYLNRMDGREIVRDGHKNELSEYGLKILEHIQSPLFKALLHWEKTEEFTEQPSPFEVVWRKPKSRKKKRREQKEKK